jgi:hypothetical protein
LEESDAQPVKKENKAFFSDLVTTRKVIALENDATQSNRIGSE